MAYMVCALITRISERAKKRSRNRSKRREMKGVHGSGEDTDCKLGIVDCLILYLLMTFLGVNTA